MTDAPNFLDFLRPAPVIAILRGLEPDVCYSAAGALARAGLRAVEVTMNTPGVADIIAELGRRFPDLAVGAGTVCTPAELEVALGAGAAFVVTPILDERVIAGCTERGIPVFPGAYTPTEIYRAWRLGATAVKVFPAGGLGVGYVKDLAGPLPQIPLVPTGGVSPENVADFLAAGAVAVGMGSSLLRRDLVAAADWAGLEAHARLVLNPRSAG